MVCVLKLRESEATILVVCLLFFIEREDWPREKLLVSHTVCN
jgi:hypothetical protein